MPCHKHHRRWRKRRNSECFRYYMHTYLEIIGYSDIPKFSVPPSIYGQNYTTETDVIEGNDISLLCKVLRGKPEPAVRMEYKVYICVILMVVSCAFDTFILILVTRLDRVENRYIRGTAHVQPLGLKVREATLRWYVRLSCGCYFGLTRRSHIERIDQDDVRGYGKDCSKRKWWQGAYGGDWSVAKTRLEIWKHKEDAEKCNLKSLKGCLI